MAFHTVKDLLAESQKGVGLQIHFAFQVAEKEGRKLDVGSEYFLQILFDKIDFLQIFLFAADDNHFFHVFPFHRFDISFTPGRLFCPGAAESVLLRVR